MVACDVPGIKRLLPSQWRESKFFDNIYELVGVPVVTVQLRYNGWVTELQDLEQSRWISIYADALIVKAGCFFQWPRISSAVGFFWDYTRHFSDKPLLLSIGRQLQQAAGLDNLLYTPDADFSCFADLALTSPEDYYIEGQGSLLQ